MPSDGTPSLKNPNEQGSALGPSHPPHIVLKPLSITSPSPRLPFEALRATGARTGLGKLTNLGRRSEISVPPAPTPHAKSAKKWANFPFRASCAARLCVGIHGTGVRRLGDVLPLYRLGRRSARAGPFVPPVPGQSGSPRSSTLWGESISHLNFFCLHYLCRFLWRPARCLGPSTICLLPVAFRLACAKIFLCLGLGIEWEVELPQH
ncbi:hypothetical protein VUR80DRAFT_3072 [Thermomyces stellatus]